MKERNGAFLKSTIYGGLDGIITTFAVVAGVIGASLDSSIILILGFANLVADGISMAVGDYMSTKSEQEYVKKKNAEPWHLGAITFISFAVFGFVPLLAYVIDAAFGFGFNLFHTSIALTGLALFGLGAIKTYVTKTHWFKGGVEMLAVGSIAAVAAYAIGYFVSTLI